MPIYNDTTETWIHTNIYIYIHVSTAMRQSSEAFLRSIASWHWAWRMAASNRSRMFNEEDAGANSLDSSASSSRSSTRFNNKRLFASLSFFTGKEDKDNNEGAEAEDEKCGAGTRPNNISITEQPDDEDWSSVGSLAIIALTSFIEGMDTSRCSLWGRYSKIRCLEDQSIIDFLSRPLFDRSHSMKGRAV